MFSPLRGKTIYAQRLTENACIADLTDLGFTRLIPKFIVLIENFDGLETVIEDEIEMPYPYLHRIVMRTWGSDPLEKRQDEFINRVATMPCFFYRVFNGRTQWNSLTMRLRDFMSHETIFWRDYTPSPSPVRVKRWLVESA